MQRMRTQCVRDRREVSVDVRGARATRGEQDVARERCFERGTGTHVAVSAELAALGSCLAEHSRAGYAARCARRRLGGGGGVRLDTPLVEAAQQLEMIEHRKLLSHAAMEVFDSTRTAAVRVIHNARDAELADLRFLPRDKPLLLDLAPRRLLWILNVHRKAVVLGDARAPVLNAGAHLAPPPALQQRHSEEQEHERDGDPRTPKHWAHRGVVRVTVRPNEHAVENCGGDERERRKCVIVPGKVDTQRRGTVSGVHHRRAARYTLIPYDIRGARGAFASTRGASSLDVPVRLPYQVVAVLRRGHPLPEESPAVLPVFRYDRNGSDNVNRRVPGGRKRAVERGNGNEGPISRRTFGVILAAQRRGPRRNVPYANCAAEHD